MQVRLDSRICTKDNLFNSSLVGSYLNFSKMWPSKAGLTVQHQIKVEDLAEASVLGCMLAVNMLPSREIQKAIVST